eukprot:2320960-Pleurochrysis_carterae.AAC.1
MFQLLAMACCLSSAPGRGGEAESVKHRSFDGLKNSKKNGKVTGSFYYPQSARRRWNVDDRVNASSVPSISDRCVNAEAFLAWPLSLSRSRTRFGERECDAYSFVVSARLRRRRAVEGASAPDKGRAGHERQLPFASVLHAQPTGARLEQVPRAGGPRQLNLIHVRDGARVLRAVSRVRDWVFFAGGDSIVLAALRAAVFDKDSMERNKFAESIMAWKQHARCGQESELAFHRPH